MFDITIFSIKDAERIFNLYISDSSKCFEEISARMKYIQQELNENYYLFYLLADFSFKEFLNSNNNIEKRIESLGDVVSFLIIIYPNLKKHDNPIVNEMLVSIERGMNSI